MIFMVPRLLLTPVGAAVGWVLFNILGPATGQLDTMSDKAANREFNEKRKR